MKIRPSVACFMFSKKDIVFLDDLLDFGNLDQFEEIDLMIEDTKFVDISKLEIVRLANINTLKVLFVSFDFIEDDPERVKVTFQTCRMSRKYEILV